MWEIQGLILITFPTVFIEFLFRHLLLKEWEMGLRQMIEKCFSAQFFFRNKINVDMLGCSQQTSSFN